MFYRTCILFLALFTVSQVSAAVDTLSNDKTITWAGCGITKKAFMKELAKAYEAKTGIKIILQGGGATKGIRETEIGRASCRERV